MADHLNGRGVNGRDVKPSKVLAILGCGTLGSAILFGLLAGKEQETNGDTGLERTPNGKSSIACNGEAGHPKPTRFIACVRTKESASRLKHEVATAFPYPVPVEISQSSNVSAVKAASTVLLGCQPQDLDDCLEEDGLVQALQGKLVISILAGITVTDLESRINRPPFAKHRAPATIVRGMPNTSALHKASTTLLNVSAAHPPPPDTLALTNTLLSSIGGVHPTRSEDMDACTAICGSTPAFFALMLDGLLDGAVALGLKRSRAKMMLIETMRGVAEGLLVNGDTEGLAEQVCTPGGSSIQGMLVLERQGIRGVLADAVCAAAGANKTLDRHN